MENIEFFQIQEHIYIFTVEFNYSMTNGRGVWNPEYFLKRSKTTSNGALQGYVKNSS